MHASRHPEQFLRCLDCGGEYALLRRPLFFGEQIHPGDIVQLSGEPIDMADEAHCGSCGRPAPFVVALRDQPGKIWIPRVLA
jgi:hypothetical protein